MILLINTSNIKIGGALQVANSFLNEIKNNTQHTFYVVLSSKLEEQIEENTFPKNFIFYHYSINLNLIKALLGKDFFLSNLEKEIKPDCIFTVFGPAYWTPQAKNIMGFADGWCYNPESLAFKNISIFNKLMIILLIKVKTYRLKKELNLIIVETNDAKNRISSLLNVPTSKIKVVSNTLNQVFNLIEPEQFDLNLKLEGEFRLITISANHQNKNLKIIKEVIPFLKNKEMKVCFYLTIDNDSFRAMFKGFEDYVINLGPIKIKYAPSVYKQCDALFLPTLLETFSVSYLEAMKMEKPILTSDLNFAHDVCGEAAEYFDPMNPKDIADKIEKIMTDPDRRSYLTEQGKNRLKNFETSASRAEKYLAICQKITN